MRPSESALAPAWAIRLLRCWVCQVCRLCQVCQLLAQPCGHHRGLKNLVPTSSAKFPASRDHTRVQTCAHTFTHKHTLTIPRSHSLSQMCFPRVPLTPIPLLHRDEEGPASTGMSSSTRASMGGHSCSVLRDLGASQGCVVAAGCVRGDTVHSQALEHLPPSCCPRVLGLLGEPAGLLSRNGLFISLLRKIDSFPK